MSVTSDSVLEKAARLLGDTPNEHWPAPTLLNYLNEAQLDIATEVGGSSTTEVAVTCVEGARQVLPAGGLSPLAIAGVREVSKEMMDREQVDWQTAVTKDNASTMWMPNLHADEEFYVYPPRTATPGTITVEYNVAPSEVTLGDNLSIGDEYANALVNYIVARGLSEDTDRKDEARANDFQVLYNAEIKE